MAEELSTNHNVDVLHSDFVPSPLSGRPYRTTVTVREFSSLKNMQTNNSLAVSFVEKYHTGLERWPPDVEIHLSELKQLITCQLCKGFFFNATTITECLHTFCRSCIAKHTENSLMCPTCHILIHPTDPAANMRTDSTMQDIVYNLFPDIRKRDEANQKEFYTSKGLPWPPLSKSKSVHSKRYVNKMRKRMERPVHVTLHHSGTTPEIGRFKCLDRRYLRIPARTTIRHIKLFLRKKLKLPNEIEAVMFVGDRLVKDHVNLDTLESCHPWGEQEESTVLLQYGIVQRAQFSALLDGTLELESESESEYETNSETSEYDEGSEEAVYEEDYLQEEH